MRQFLSIGLAACCGSLVAADDPGPKKRDRDAAYQIDDSTWGWIPVLIVGIFVLMLLSTVKSKRFGGLSLRLYLMRFISVEVLYNTLKGASAHQVHEQRNIELGHQVFSAFGVILLVVNTWFNPDADKRYAMAVLTYAQIGFLTANIALDVLLIFKFQRTDKVRSVNSKLRFAHSVYQVVLFCSDTIGGDLHLPVDCYIWATTHYAYEAVGLALEGLNVIGMSELSIIVLLNSKILGTDAASTGWRCAFGMSALGLSIVSIGFAQLYKWLTLSDTEGGGGGDHDEHELPPSVQETPPPSSGNEGAGVSSQALLRT